MSSRIPCRSKQFNLKTSEGAGSERFGVGLLDLVPIGLVLHASQVSAAFSSVGFGSEPWQEQHRRFQNFVLLGLRSLHLSSPVGSGCPGDKPELWRWVFAC